MALRINIGCGQNPTQGWRNFDNSLSLRFSTIPYMPALLMKLKIIESSQYQFIKFARQNNIEYGNATKGLPFQDKSVDVIYSSHMLEHIDRTEAANFLLEAYRILRPGGIIRLALPDIKKQVEQYNKSGDADAFIESTHMCVPSSGTFAKRLQLLFVGNRNHQWMYDGNSLCRLLQKQGFFKTEVIPPGQTRIADYKPLDLHERVSESVYVEAEKPVA